MGQSMTLAEMLHWQAQDQLGSQFAVFVPIAVLGRAPTQPRSLDQIQQRLQSPLIHHQGPPNEEIAIAAPADRQQERAPKTAKQAAAAACEREQAPSERKRQGGTAPKAMANPPTRRPAGLRKLSAIRTHNAEAKRILKWVN